MSLMLHDIITLKTGYVTIPLVPARDVLEREPRGVSGLPRLLSHLLRPRPRLLLHLLQRLADGHRQLCVRLPGRHPAGPPGPGLLALPPSLLGVQRHQLYSLQVVQIECRVRYLIVIHPLACRAGFLLGQDGDCGVECPARTGPDQSTSTCQPCPPGCAECGAGVGCTACPTPLLLSAGRCVSSCPPGTSQWAGSCSPCHASCHACRGPGPANCTACLPGARLTSAGACLGCLPGLCPVPFPSLAPDLGITISPPPEFFSGQLVVVVGAGAGLLLLLLAALTLCPSAPRPAPRYTRVESEGLREESSEDSDEEEFLIVDNCRTEKL